MIVEGPPPWGQREPARLLRIDLGQVDDLATRRRGVGCRQQPQDRHVDIALLPDRPDETRRVLPPRRFHLQLRQLTENHTRRRAQHQRGDAGRRRWHGSVCPPVLAAGQDGSAVDDLNRGEPGRESAVPELPVAVAAPAPGTAVGSCGTGVLDGRR